MATHSTILAWRIPWTEKAGGLQSMGPHRLGQDWATNKHLRKNQIMPLAVVWVGLKIVIMSTVSQRKMNIV